MEAQQVNGLVAQDLQEKSEAVAQQAKDIRHLENNTKILENDGAGFYRGTMQRCTQKIWW